MENTNYSSAVPPKLTNKKIEIRQSDFKTIFCKKTESAREFENNINNKFFDHKHHYGSECSRAVYFFNYCSGQIEVTERSGVKRFLHNHFNNLFRGLVVKVVYYTGTNVNLDSKDISNSQRISERKTYEAIIDPTNSIGGESSEVYYTFDETDVITDDGRPVYILDLDIMINSVAGSRANSYHPYSNLGAFKNYFRSIPLAGYNASSIFMTLIDSSRKINARYVNINDKIIKVEAQHDVELPDGFYTFTNNNALGQDTSGEDYTYYSLEEIDSSEVNFVFKTYDEATTKGDYAYVKEKEKLKRELEKTEKELELEKKKIETKEKELESKLKTIAHNLEHEKTMDKLTTVKEEYDFRRQQDLNMMKDSFESRSYARKDSLEGVKTVGALATAAAGMFLLYKKFS